MNPLQVIKLVLLVLTIPTLWSCTGDKLNRGKAEKLIKVKLNLPHDEIRDVNLFVTKTERIVSTSEDVHTESPKEGILLKLEQNGLITYSVERISSSIVDRTWWNGGLGFSTNIDFFTGKVDPNRVLKITIVETYNHIGALTEEGKKYLVNGNQFKLATIEFGEITGIIERKELNNAEVNYTYKRKNITPFGKAYGIYEETFNGTAIFTKYDDGWRIN